MAGSWIAGEKGWGTADRMALGAGLVAQFGAPLRAGGARHDHQQGCRREVLHAKEIDSCAARPFAPDISR
jgi:hypothetical protein